MGTEPQEPFTSNCHSLDQIGKVKVLQWTNLCTVTLREETQANVLEIDFANRAFHPIINLKDDFGFAIAQANTSGIFLATEGSEEKQTELVYLPLKDFNKQWQFQL